MQRLDADKMFQIYCKQLLFSHNTQKIPKNPLYFQPRKHKTDIPEGNSSTKIMLDRKYYPYVIVIIESNKYQGRNKIYKELKIL